MNNIKILVFLLKIHFLLQWIAIFLCVKIRFLTLARLKKIKCPGIKWIIIWSDLTVFFIKIRNIQAPLQSYIHDKIYPISLRKHRWKIGSYYCFLQKDQNYMSLFTDEMLNFRQDHDKDVSKSFLWYNEVEGSYDNTVINKGRHMCHRYNCDKKKSVFKELTFWWRRYYWGYKRPFSQMF